VNFLYIWTYIFPSHHLLHQVGLYVVVTTGDNQLINWWKNELWKLWKVSSIQMKILNYIACTMNSNIENSIQLISDLIENWNFELNSNSWLDQLNSDAYIGIWIEIQFNNCIKVQLNWIQILELTNWIQMHRLEFELNSNSTIGLRFNWIEFKFNSK